MKIHDLLKELNACDSAQKWASDKTWEQIYNECHRGDWLCWLFVRTNPNDIQLLTLVKGHQANTVRHLMKDERSLAAVDAAIAFGEGKITIDELNLAAIKAYDVYAAKSYDVYDVSAAAYASHAAAYAAAYSAYAADAAAYSADAAAYSAAAAATSKEQNQQEGAYIFRKFIPINKFNI